MVNEQTKAVVQYGYDDFGNLAWAKYEDNSYDYKMPDKAGNIYRTKDQNDRKYGPGGRLLESKGTKYEYDEEGNLVLKITPDGKQWLFKWAGNGILKKVIRPDKKEVSFDYDALGRRTAKIYDKKITRWIWDGNTPLHEWKYEITERPKTMVDEFGDVRTDKAEPIDNLISWIFNEGGFKPLAKVESDTIQSIITDYLGTPVEMFDKDGNQTWSVDYDIYGKIRNQYYGAANDCPFRYQGQYEDSETGLFYNRFRYYAPDEGIYLSQDPIGLNSDCWLFYAYVKDPNRLVDVFGLYNGEGVRELGSYDSHHTHVLSNSEYTNSDPYHFAKGNESLHNRFQTDPKFAEAMETKYPGIKDHVAPGAKGGFSSEAPPGTTWHHSSTPGHLELVDRVDHKKYHKIYHPDGEGGRKKWGGGNVCR
jgi:RHS repeat-associated protein